MQKKRETIDEFVKRAKKKGKTYAELQIEETEEMMTKIEPLPGHYTAAEWEMIRK